MRARHRIIHPLQQRVVNPIVNLAWELNIPIPGDALLETTGRRTGRPRRTPVCDGLDGETFWLVAQRGRGADWVQNIEANPRVRIKVSGLRTTWRAGTAHILDGDDPGQRHLLPRRGAQAVAVPDQHSTRIYARPMTVADDYRSPSYSPRPAGVRSCRSSGSTLIRQHVEQQRTPGG